MNPRRKTIASIIQFLDGDAPQIRKISGYKDRIRILAKNGKVKEVPVMIFFATFKNGNTGATLVAADRNVSYEEILKAHSHLIAS